VDAYNFLFSGKVNTLSQNIGNASQGGNYPLITFCLFTLWPALHPFLVIDEAIFSNILSEPSTSCNRNFTQGLSVVCFNEPRYNVTVPLSVKGDKTLPSSVRLRWSKSEYLYDYIRTIQPNSFLASFSHLYWKSLFTCLDPIRNMVTLP
jgi:hypothetical protein